MRKTRTTAHNPAGDGMVEQLNQTLERVLAHYVSDHQRDWDVYLLAMVMVYRATPRGSTGYSPAYLLFGLEMCLPQDVAYGLPPAIGEANELAGYAKDRPAEVVGSACCCA